MLHKNTKTLFGQQIRKIITIIKFISFLTWQLATTWQKNLILSTQFKMLASIVMFPPNSLQNKIIILIVVIV